MVTGAAERNRLIENLADSMEDLVATLDEENTSDIVGFEALSRFGSGSPSRWFAIAGRVGLQLDLELSCIRKAIWTAAEIEDGFVAINLSSGLLASGGLLDSLQEVDATRVIIELSESSQIDHYETASEAIGQLTSRGSVWLDDVGNAGSISGASFGSAPRS